MSSGFKVPSSKWRGLILLVILLCGTTGGMVWAGETPQLPPREVLKVRLSGNFLRGERRPQALVWTRRPDGLSTLRLWVRGRAGWSVAARLSFAAMWHLEAGDIDYDGLNDVLIGLEKRSKLDVRVRRRLHVYGIERRRGFRPKWRGSELTRPLRQFRLLPRGRAFDLIALEKNPLPAYRDFEWIGVYRWNGFGFVLVWDTPVRGHIAAWRTGRDRHGPFLVLRQKQNQTKRTIVLRPSRSGFKAEAVGPPESGL